MSLHTSYVTDFSLGSFDSFVLWVTITGGLLSLTATGSDCTVSFTERLL